MPRVAPQIDRVVAIINLLSGRTEGATLTEMADELHESQSTMVHVLAALTTAGYLVREQPGRRYHLGPALVEPGRVAADRYQGLAVAHRHMDRLSRTFGSACYAFVRDRCWARLVQYTWDPSHPVPPMRIGELIPMVPPLGAVSWRGPRPNRSTSGSLPILRCRTTGSRGCGRRLSACGASDSRWRSVATKAWGTRCSIAYKSHPRLRGDEELRRLLSNEECLVTRISPHATYWVTAIGAPVFGPSGGVELSITLSPFNHSLSGRELKAVGHQVRLAADAVTEEVGGHHRDARSTRPR